MTPIPLGRGWYLTAWPYRRPWFDYAPSRNNAHAWWVGHGQPVASWLAGMVPFGPTRYPRELGPSER